ncbi:lipopolysaccharide assembly protein LapA domain-containing protein [Ovoidimarina sediminis]|uniref:lipopolysaccharide assembly protein LapA domain-containing protein n=1 Tax=Ovoidimarina sediminis TaxID=3079856 RepID=UPI00291331DC|nr:lipopolysaccharide assembly protein LapA domain-containing protein [Rhodophyticola sp. MJ-SS7]MDU8942800.1 lipopolysaccharide assembly protein LapA domain-containing protein [Rhodophyticola sp. MJ-SS7]
MRYIRYLFLATVGLILLIVALANRGPVTLTVLPEELAAFAGWNAQVTLPIFAVILASIVVGLLIGFVWEWMREYKHRAAASHHRRERERLEKEVDRLKTPADGSGDDVLALLDKAS